jgi:hypothetical protein
MTRALLCTVLLAALVIPEAFGAGSPKLMAHYMPWHQSKPVSGQWGWHWTMNHYDPELIDESGRRQIASHQYPVVGPYDSTDLDLLYYHFLLMKVAGIDGVIIDWYGAADVFDYAGINRATGLAIEAAERFGLEYAICYEDRTLRARVDAGRITPEEAADRAQDDMRYLAAHWLSRPGHLRIDGRPVLLVFGPEYLSDAQWQSVLDDMPSNPAFITLHQRREPADGLYAWPPMWASENGVLTPERLAVYFERYAERAADSTYSIPAAFPGFHDIYAEAGAQESHGVLHHRDGATFDETLAVAMSSGTEIVQLVTWNDFGEGTAIEPTREFGYRYLERVQAAVRERSGSDFVYVADDLRLPERIFALRKKHAGDGSALARVRQAEVHLSDAATAAARAGLVDVDPR